jgi:hypothetical protein
VLPVEAGLDPAKGSILVDTNLLVLLVVGAVNRDRIESFKRPANTRNGYSRGAFSNKRFPS